MYSRGRRGDYRREGRAHSVHGGFLRWPGLGIAGLMHMRRYGGCSRVVGNKFRLGYGFRLGRSGIVGQVRPSLRLGVIPAGLGYGAFALIHMEHAGGFPRWWGSARSGHGSFYSLRMIPARAGWVSDWLHQDQLAGMSPG